MPTVQIVIEGDESGAINSLDQINQKAAQLSSGMAAVGSASDEATGRVVSGFTRGREAAALLSEETGVTIPRALRGVLAETELIGPALQAAFGVTAVIAFVEVIARVPDAINGAIDRLTGWKAAADAMNTSQAALNKTLEETNKQIQDAQRQGATIGMGPLGSAQTALGFSQSDLAKQQALVGSLSQQLAAMRNATMTVPGGIGPSGEIIAPQTVGADLTGTQRFTDLEAALEEASAKLKLLQQDASNAGAKMAEIGSADDVAQLLKYNAQMDQLIQKNEQYANSVQKTLDLSKQMSSLAEEKGIPGGAPGALMGMPTPFGDESLNFIDTGAARSTQTFKDLDAQMMVNMETDQKVAQQGEESARRYAEAWTRARDTMANQLDSFFSELTSGNIAQAFLKQFEKLVSQMVATWLMGIQGMQQAVTRSGGLFGSLFGMGEGGGGSFLGGGGGSLSTAIPGIDASFMNGSDMGGILGGGSSSLLGVPLSGGGGAASVSLSSLPAGASNVGSVFGGSGASGGFLSMLGHLLPVGALAGGAALLGKGGVAGLFGSTALGFGGGALAGSFLASAATPLLESGVIGGALAGTLEAIGPFLGPIGAGIGLVAGLISLFSGDGKLKTQQANLQNQEQTDLINLENAFSLHQIDYNSAIAQAEQIRQSYTQQQEALKKGGSAGRVDAVVDDIEQQINNLEQQRQNVLGAAPNYGPAQFERGGFVHPFMARLAPPGFAPAMHFATGGAVPAIVHAGEYVLNARTVNRLGVRNLDAENSGGGSGGGDHYHMHFPGVYDSRGFEQTLRSNIPALRRTLAHARATGAM